MGMVEIDLAVNEMDHRIQIVSTTFFNYMFVIGENPLAFIGISDEPPRLNLRGLV